MAERSQYSSNYAWNMNVNNGNMNNNDKDNDNYVRPVSAIPGAADTARGTFQPW